MITRSICLLLVMLSTDFAHAALRFKNDSNFSVSVKLKREGTDTYLGPYNFKPGAVKTISVDGGIYQLLMQRGDGQRQKMPYRKYEDDRTITYHVSLCATCAPSNEKPVRVQTVFISHTGKERVFRPTYTLGSYRLGAEVIDDPRGARVIAVEVDSPAYKLKRAGDDTTYWLHELNSIITHVNDSRVRNKTDFERAIESSPERVKLNVYSTTRGTAIEHWTKLR